MLTPSHLHSLRRRLAGRLTLVALAGLTACSLAAFGMGIVIDIAFRRAWAGVTAGNPTEAGVWVICALTLGMTTIHILGVCWATWPTPTGIRLPRKAAPAFFQWMDEIAVKQGARPINRVWIGADMNAVLMQRPAFGWWGPIQTHLVIGLPLIHCISVDQFRAVIAHEFGHLAFQRSGIGAYFAHLRAWWAKVIDTAYEDFPWTETFSKRFSALFYRDMLRLARLEEFEADRSAADVVGEQLLGETLIEISLKGRFLDQDYWPSVFEASLDSEGSDVRPYRQMGLGVAVGFLRRESVVEDLSIYEAGKGLLPLHPTLTERLHALGAQLEVPPEYPGTAADHFFADLLPTLSWALDRGWRDDDRQSWDAEDQRHSARFAEAGFRDSRRSPQARLLINPAIFRNFARRTPPNPSDRD